MIWICVDTHQYMFLLGGGKWEATILQQTQTAGGWAVSHETPHVFTDFDQLVIIFCLLSFVHYLFVRDCFYSLLITINSI